MSDGNLKEGDFVRVRVSEHMILYKKGEHISTVMYTDSETGETVYKDYHNGELLKIPT